jgi:hypothetical protein
MNRMVGRNSSSVPPNDTCATSHIMHPQCQHIKVLTALWHTLRHNLCTA